MTDDTQRLPDGVLLDIKIYVIGKIDGIDTPARLIVRNIPIIPTEIFALDAARKALDEVMTDLRLMTRQEVIDYEADEEYDDE